MVNVGIRPARKGDLQEIRNLVHNGLLEANNQFYFNCVISCLPIQVSKKKLFIRERSNII